MCESVGILFLIYLVAGSALACDIRSIKQCRQTFMNDSGISENKSVGNIDFLNASRFDPMCTYQNNTLTCMNDVVLNQCGVESSTVYQFITSHILQWTNPTHGSCDKAGSSMACDKIVQCQQTFMSDIGLDGGMSSQNKTVLNSLQSAEQVNLICTSFRTFQQCYDTFVTYCVSDDTLNTVVSYLDDMYSFICNTERADIIRYSGCWNSISVQNGMIQCQGSLTMTQSSVSSVCKTLENALTCMGDVVYNQCGVKSTTVYTSIMSYSLLMVFSRNGECQNVKQTFGTVGKNPYENGRVPSNASSNKPTNYAYVMCIAMIFAVVIEKYKFV